MNTPDQTASAIFCLPLELMCIMSFSKSVIIQRVEKMSTNPARILKLESGLKVGQSANITIIDPALSYKVKAGNFQSLSHNTPFDGWRLKGKPVLTMLAGKIIFKEGIN